MSELRYLDAEGSWMFGAGNNELGTKSSGKSIVYH